MSKRSNNQNRTYATQSAHGATAAIWSGQEHGFEVRSAALPEPGPGELVVAVELATICGSDLHTINGHRQTPLPTVLGHEAVGQVIAIGPETSTASIGDRVTWTVGTACDACSRCTRGVPQKCRHIRKYGHEAIDDRWQLNGAFASHVHLLAGTGVVPVPADLPAAVVAPAGCATATVACAARKAGLDSNAAVVVIGCGMLGLTAVAYAYDLGASVIACDIDPHRRELAIALGARDACGPDELSSVAREHGADIVFEFSGDHRAVVAAFDVVDLAGVVALIGSVSPGPSVPVDPNALVRNLTTVVGVHNYAHHDLEDAVAFLARTSARELLEWLVPAPYPIDRIDRAVAHAGDGTTPRIAVRS